MTGFKASKCADRRSRAPSSRQPIILISSSPLLRASQFKVRPNKVLPFYNHTISPFRCAIVQRNRRLRSESSLLVFSRKLSTYHCRTAHTSTYFIMPYPGHTSLLFSRVSTGLGPSNPMLRNRCLAFIVFMKGDSSNSLAFGACVQQKYRKSSGLA